jgi:hypothetical protein
MMPAESGANMIDGYGEGIHGGHVWGGIRRSATWRISTAYGVFERQSPEYVVVTWR